MTVVMIIYKSFENIVGTNEEEKIMIKNIIEIAKHNIDEN